MIFSIIKSITLLIIKDGTLQLVKKTIKDNLANTNLNLYNKYKYFKDALHKKKTEKPVDL
tara:strand:- start:3888 stop:4067 length:180 start_codon:yes stop_codon:yes gene_type:complete